jgi:VIT1/CCC1 family predicted Fe2+/Mn2+ transporter
LNGELKRYAENLQGEIDGAALYRELERLESDPGLKRIYGRLADAEERHAEIWRAKLRQAGVVRQERPSWRTRTMIALARRFGTGFILPTIGGWETADRDRYRGQPEAVDAGLPAEEQSHARLFNAISGARLSGISGQAIAQLEGRHRSGGGNALRAAVLGANDGLVSNASLVMGVAGADLAGRSILITGLAGLLAGSLSMALGEWLSVQSARELYARQIGIEQDELEAAPEEEAEELALIYQSRGLPEEHAKALAEKLISDPALALDTLAREELNVDPDELGGSAWVAAVTSFLLFSAGAIIPVLPYFFTDGGAAVALSVLLSLIGLFAIGAGITLITGRSALFSGGRQVAFGIVAAAITFGVGRLFNAAIGG